MNHRRHLKQSFIATVATAAAAFSGGCFVNTVSNPPRPDCPSEAPSAGDGCQQDAVCVYDDGPCPVEYTCTEAGWTNTTNGSCNPPPPTCPSELPLAGTVCEPQLDTWGTYPSGCSYTVDTPCGEQTLEASCANDPDFDEIVWQLSYTASCQTEPEDCGAYERADLCHGDAGCQWLTPGCADGFNSPAAVEGCYPAGDCAVDGCGTWGSCETVVFDPCWGSSCEACGMETNVCLPASEEEEDIAG